MLGRILTFSTNFIINLVTEFDYESHILISLQNGTTIFLSNEYRGRYALLLARGFQPTNVLKIPLHGADLTGPVARRDVYAPNILEIITSVF